MKKKITRPTSFVLRDITSSKMTLKSFFEIIHVVTNNFFCKSFLPIASCNWFRIQQYLYFSSIQLVKLLINDCHLSFQLWVWFLSIHSQIVPTHQIWERCLALSPREQSSRLTISWINATLFEVLMKVLRTHLANEKRLEVFMVVRLFAIAHFTKDEITQKSLLMHLKTVDARNFIQFMVNELSPEE